MPISESYRRERRAASRALYGRCKAEFNKLLAPENRNGYCFARHAGSACRPSLTASRSPIVSTGAQNEQETLVLACARCRVRRGLFPSSRPDRESRRLHCRRQGLRAWLAVRTRPEHPGRRSDRMPDGCRRGGDGDEFRERTGRRHHDRNFHPAACAHHVRVALGESARGNAATHDPSRCHEGDGGRARPASHRNVR